MDAEAFEGEYWNSDLKSRFITRFRFMRRANQSLVAAWGSCFPKDCDWGETRLHLLEDQDGDPRSLFAFATWNDDANTTHCLFKLKLEALHVTSIALRMESSSTTR